MFYDHKILTDPKHGVATIWLVATLGSRSSHRKITRRAILDVNLPEACQTITQPERPLALRLQGSLLYGVSRVFSQQCGYVLNDTQSLCDKMRRATVSMHDQQIDRDVASSRFEQLNLPDDPIFDVNTDMRFDLSAFGNTIAEVSDASSLSMYLSIASSQTSAFVQEQDNGSHESVSDISFEGLARVEPPGDAGTSSVAQLSHQNAFISLPNEQAVFEDNVFEIGDDGGILTMTHENTHLQPVVDSHGDNSEGIGTRITGGRNENNNLDFEDLVPDTFPDDELPIMPSDAPPFEHQVIRLSDIVPSPELEPDQDDETAHLTAEATQRYIKTPKILRIDHVAELSNRDLSQWSSDYLEEMARADYAKINRISVSQARKNAAFWILDQGIGAVETNFGDDRTPHPLSVFSGPELISILMGEVASPPGRKRSASSTSDSDDAQSTRRVRARLDEQTAGDLLHMQDIHQDEMVPQVDDVDVESEVGREAPSSLQEHVSSQMPWNISSHHGSRQGTVLPVGSSGAGGVKFGPPSLLKSRRSRLFAASPLLDKGGVQPRFSSQDSDIPDEPQDHGMDAFSDPSLPSVGDDDFELYGPAAVLDTQEAAQSQWVTALLERETNNFLGFLQTKIKESDENGAVDDEAQPQTTFEILLPAQRNSKIVAAQGFLHVLALTTQGLLRVRQDVAFGEIMLSVVEDDALPDAI